MKSGGDLNKNLCEKIWQGFCQEPGNIGMGRRVFPFWRKVMRGIKLQYLLEAQEHHMDVNQYIDWLKQQAHIKTKYDCLHQCFEELKSPEERPEGLVKRLEEA